MRRVFVKRHPGTIFVAGWDAGIDYTIANGAFSWGALAVDTAADFLAGKKPKQKSVYKPSTKSPTPTSIRSRTRS
jgi:ABC-type sugar transport system substrate-binding protein